MVSVARFFPRCERGALFPKMVSVARFLLFGFRGMASASCVGACALVES
jgi:hypothetical protein